MFGILPVHLLGLRLPDHTTSNIFSKLWPLLAPALDDLDSIQISGGRIFYGPHDKGRSFGFCRRQIAPHRDASRVRMFYPILTIQDVLGVVPSAEEAYFDVRTTGAERLFPLHAVENRGAGVLLSPDARNSRRVLEPDVQTGEQITRHAGFDLAVQAGVTAIEIFLAIRHAGVVRV